MNWHVSISSTGYVATADRHKLNDARINVNELLTFVSFTELLTNVLLIETFHTIPL